MNAAKVTLTSTILAAALGLALGLAAAPAMADKPDCELDSNHHGCGGEDPDPTLGMCPESPCIADVGRILRDNPPARQYTETVGTYTKIGSKDFDRILETLMEGKPADDLCDAHDVLIFNWNSPTIKKLNWQRLLDYMECGGGVIFEDPRNVGVLAAGAEGSDGVSTLEVTIHSRDDFPLPITSLGEPPNDNSTETLIFVNKHIIFDLGNSDGALIPFLSLEVNGDVVVGLYGQFGTGLGRIVLTGPDNNFHGDDDPDVNDPAFDAKIHHFDLLFNEIDWLLE